MKVSNPILLFVYKWFFFGELKIPTKYQNFKPTQYSYLQLTPVYLKILRHTQHWYGPKVGLVPKLRVQAKSAVEYGPPYCECPACWECTPPLGTPWQSTRQSISWTYIYVDQKGEDYCAYSLSVANGLTPTYRGKILKE